MRSLSILFTNNTLAARAGSELWVRDVCRALVSRGHHPIAFSLVTGAVADDLRAATVPVVSDLDEVGFTPDLIHGHHHIETLIAALHFPGVPIVHFCHGWLPWEEAPLRHPAIARYVAVDETGTERLTAENGIPPGQVDRLPNFVDLKRFLPRGPLPPRPRSALILSNDADEHGYAAIIREACQAQGIALEIAGIRSGRSIERPDELLPDFDLVFAKGRAALEAMAVGCSVVVADVIGCGPLVTARDFDRMRAGNFGIRWLQQPHSVDWYRAQIAAYDTADAGLVSTRVREEAGLDLAVDRLLAIYARVIAGPGPDAAPDRSGVQWHAKAQRAAASHLSSVARRFKRSNGLEAAVQTLSNELASSHSHYERAVQERESFLKQAETLTNAVAASGTLTEQLTRERDLLSHERDALTHQCRVLTHERDVLTHERDVLTHDRDVLTHERDVLTHERGVLTHERDLVTYDRADLTRERDALIHDRDVLSRERDGLRQLVAEFRRLKTLRLRDRLIHIPIVGNAALRAVRWLNRS